MQFDWLTAFWPITREPQFFQIWDWWWNINNNISFQFRLFQRKTNDKTFQKIQKKTILGAILEPFCQNLGKNEFSWEKRAQSIFRYCNYHPSCEKSEKTNEPFLRKMPNWKTDRQMDRWMDRQATVILWDPPWDGGPKNWW